MNKIKKALAETRRAAAAPGEEISGEHSAEGDQALAELAIAKMGLSILPAELEPYHPASSVMDMTPGACVTSCTKVHGGRTAMCFCNHDSVPEIY